MSFNEREKTMEALANDYPVFKTLRYSITLSESMIKIIDLFVHDNTELSEFYHHEDLIDYLEMLKTHTKKAKYYEWLFYTTMEENPEYEEFVLEEMQRFVDEMPLIDAVFDSLAGDFIVTCVGVVKEERE